MLLLPAKLFWTCLVVLIISATTIRADITNTKTETVFSGLSILSIIIMIVSAIWYIWI